MNKELIEVKKTELVNLVEGQEIGNLLKPMVREIHLFDSFVANTSILKDKSPLKEIKTGDRLLLQREKNKFDENSIIVLTETKKHLGYIPERDNVIFARLLDAGKSLIAYIKSIKGQEGYTQIAISIHLQDF